MTSVTAIVLVGGRSTRLGRSKAREMIDGRSIIQRVLDATQPLADEVLLVAARGQDTSWLPRGGRIRHIVDAYADSGPLVGIYSGLAAAHSDRCVAVACDMPLLKTELLQSLVELLSGCDAVVPRLEGRAQPLHAVYARSCAGVMHKALEQGSRSLHDVLRDLNVRWVEDHEMPEARALALSCFNVNTPGDLRCAVELLNKTCHVHPYPDGTDTL